MTTVALILLAAAAALIGLILRCLRELADIDDVLADIDFTAHAEQACALTHTFTGDELADLRAIFAADQEAAQS